MTISAIIFDLGGVLLNWNPLALYQKHFPALPAAEIQRFLREVDFHTWNLKQDQGRSFDEGVADLSAQFPHYAPLIAAYHHHWPDCIDGQIDGSVVLLERLKSAGAFVGLLTNCSVEKFSLARETYPFLDSFDHVVVSGAIGLLKPDPAIYHLTLAEVGRRASECVFIDDNQQNVAAAGELGFAAIHFQSPDQLECELHALGLLA